MEYHQDVSDYRIFKSSRYSNNIASLTVQFKSSNPHVNPVMENLVEEKCQKKLRSGSKLALFQLKVSNLLSACSNETQTELERTNEIII